MGWWKSARSGRTRRVPVLPGVNIARERLTVRTVARNVDRGIDFSVQPQPATLGSDVAGGHQTVVAYRQALEVVAAARVRRGNCPESGTLVCKCDLGSGRHSSGRITDNADDSRVPLRIHIRRGQYYTDGQQTQSQ